MTHPERNRQLAQSGQPCSRKKCLPHRVVVRLKWRTMNATLRSLKKTPVGCRRNLLKIPCKEIAHFMYCNFIWLWKVSGKWVWSHVYVFYLTHKIPCNHFLLANGTCRHGFLENIFVCVSLTDLMLEVCYISPLACSVFLSVLFWTTLHYKNILIWRNLFFKKKKKHSILL